jgi:hypothetical protein
MVIAILHSMEVKALASGQQNSFRQSKQLGLIRQRKFSGGELAVRNGRPIQKKVPSSIFSSMRLPMRKTFHKISASALHATKVIFMISSPGIRFQIRIF